MTIPGFRSLHPYVRAGLVRVALAVGFSGCQCEGEGGETIPAPTLASIAPASGVAGTSVPVTLTGTNFEAGAQVHAAPVGITVSDNNVASVTSMTAVLTIAATALPGTYKISVSTSGGTSSELNFTVLPPAPTLTAIQPNAVVRGAGTVHATLTGTNLAHASLAVDVAGITTSNLNVVSSTQVTVDLTIALGTTQGAHAVTATTPSGTSNPITLSVDAPPPPALTSIVPANGIIGTSFPVTITGTNFDATVAAVAAAGNVVLSNLTFVSTTQLTGTLSIPGALTPGTNYSVSVTTQFGTSNTLPFEARAPAPTLTSLVPNSGAQGINVPVRLNGTAFQGTTAVNVSGAGVTVTNLVITSGTQIDATFVVTPTASLGNRDVTVTTPGGTTASLQFEVLPAPLPLTLTSITPNGGAFGQTINVTLVGTGFTSGATISAGTGITVSNIVVVDSTHITARFVILENATFGNHSVTVRIGTQVSNAVNFNVV